MSRFTMVARVYKHIRECIITNAKLMNETTLQLPEVNAATITQWYKIQISERCLHQFLYFNFFILCFHRYSRRYRSLEQNILMQGITAPDPPMAAPQIIPEALQKKESLHLETVIEPHHFILPPNTAGEAKLLKRKLQPIAQAPLPFQQALFSAAPPAPYILPSVQFTGVSTLPQVMITPGLSQTVPLNLPITFGVPLSAQTQRKDEEKLSGTGKRKYIKKTDVIICSKCKEERKPDSHKQYFGNWYCEKSATQSYDDWRAELQKRGYKKKKSGNDEPPAS